MSFELQQYSAAEISVEKIDELISKKISFQISDLSDISKIVKVLENCIAQHHMRCRVYTEYRAFALIGDPLIYGISVVAGVGIALHNMVTFNPDYEIGKNKFKRRVTVTYKKVA